MRANNGLKLIQTAQNGSCESIQFNVIIQQRCKTEQNPALLKGNEIHERY